MTIREAVELVLISSQLKIRENGEIFILEMGDSIYIKDLAKKMILKKILKISLIFLSAMI